MKKQFYCAPETELLSICFKSSGVICTSIDVFGADEDYLMPEEY